MSVTEKINAAMFGWPNAFIWGVIVGMVASGLGAILFGGLIWGLTR